MGILFGRGCQTCWEGVSDLVFGFSWSLGGSVGAVGERQPPNLENRIWTTQRVQVNVASLRLFLRSSTGPNRAFEPRSLGRVRDPVRIAEGPTAIDAATQRRHFGFRLRLVDKLQPIGGGSGRGHPLSGTWETWMVANVLNPVQRIRGGRGGSGSGSWAAQEATHSLGSGRADPLSGTWETWMAPNVMPTK